MVLKALRNFRVDMQRLSILWLVGVTVLAQLGAGTSVPDRQAELVTRSLPPDAPSLVNALNFKINEETARQLLPTRLADGSWVFEGKLRRGLDLPCEPRDDSRAGIDLPYKIISVLLNDLPARFNRLG